MESFSLINFSMVAVIAMVIIVLIRGYIRQRKTVSLLESGILTTAHITRVEQLTPAKGGNPQLNISIYYFTESGSKTELTFKAAVSPGFAARMIPGKTLPIKYDKNKPEKMVVVLR